MAYQLVAEVLDHAPGGPRRDRRLLVLVALAEATRHGGEWGYEGSTLRRTGLRSAGYGPLCATRRKGIDVRVRSARPAAEAAVHRVGHRPRSGCPIRPAGRLRVRQVPQGEEQVGTGGAVAPPPKEEAPQGRARRRSQDPPGATASSEGPLSGHTSEAPPRRTSPRTWTAEAPVAPPRSARRHPTPPLKSRNAAKCVHGWQVGQRRLDGRLACVVCRRTSTKERVA